MKIGQKIGERSVEIIKSSEFTEYLAEKVHQTNDPDETFAQKLSSALITMGIVNYVIFTKFHLFLSYLYLIIIKVNPFWVNMHGLV